MYIQPVSVYSNNNVKNCNGQFNNRASSVSFGLAKQPLSDAFVRYFKKANESLEEMAKGYKKTLAEIAKSLEGSGVSFDSEYNNLSTIKSPESIVDKLKREPNVKLEVPDRIRATLFVDDPYDLSTLFNKIIPAMEAKDYFVASAPIKISELVKRGYRPTSREMVNPELTKIMPDVDVRLSGDLISNKSAVPKKYEYVISEPTRSQYEDIQIRFHKKGDENETPHELIILFGKNYANAKHTESEEVYTHLRKFKKMNINFNDTNPQSYARRADEPKRSIENFFRTEISEKLYLNARDKDYYVTKEPDLAENLSNSREIEISKGKKNNVENYFNSLERCIERYYKALQDDAINDNAKDKLETKLKYDLKVLEEIKKGLDKTIKKYYQD